MPDAGVSRKRQILRGGISRELAIANRRDQTFDTGVFELATSACRTLPMIVLSDFEFAALRVRINTRCAKHWRRVFFSSNRICISSPKNKAFYESAVSAARSMLPLATCDNMTCDIMSDTFNRPRVALRCAWNRRRDGRFHR
jgi:hypothetical protein